jgi:hypothetical protein
MPGYGQGVAVPPQTAVVVEADQHELAAPGVTALAQHRDPRVKAVLDGLLRDPFVGLTDRLGARCELSLSLRSHARKTVFPRLPFRANVTLR